MIEQDIQILNHKNSVLYLRTLGNYEEVPANLLANPKSAYELSEVVIERTQSTNTLKLEKAFNLNSGIYYHKDILDKVMQEKTDFGVKIELLTEEVEGLKREREELKKVIESTSIWSIIKNRVIHFMVFSLCLMLFLCSTSCCTTVEHTKGSLDEIELKPVVLYHPSHRCKIYEYRAGDGHVYLIVRTAQGVSTTRLDY